MTTRRSLILAGGAMMLLPTALRAQGAEIGTAARPLKIGVTAGPHGQVMEKVRDIAARDGLVIRIIEFSDYIQPNVALADGDLDANYFQTVPYLEN